MGMICCEFCHSEIPDHARFCPRCGRVVAERAQGSEQQPTASLHAETDFLPMLGESLGPWHGNVPTVYGTPQAGGVPSVQGTPQMPPGSARNDAPAISAYHEALHHGNQPYQPTHPGQSASQQISHPPAQQPLHLHHQAAGPRTLPRSYVTPPKPFRQGNPILDILQKIRSLISTANGDVSRQIKTLSLFAIARATLEEDDRAFVDKPYSVQAGISQNNPEGFAGESFNLSVDNVYEPILFDISLHASENIELIGAWHIDLRYDPHNPEAQLVTFAFRVADPGSSLLVVDFYRERRWLRTIRLEFDAVDKTQLVAVPAGG